MNIKILICDDEPILCKKTQEVIKSIDPNIDTDTCYLGESVIDIADKYDIIFLDIDMPGMNGMETASLLRRRGVSSYIVFLTSHSEFMPEAFEVRAYRFLTKPLDANKVSKMIDEIKLEMSSRHKVIIKTGDREYVLSSDEIVYLAAYGDGTYIYTTHDVIDSSKSLKHWAEVLSDKQFFYVHKSYIVSYAYISELGKMSVKLRNVKEEIPVSRRKHKEFREKYISYITTCARKQ